MDNPVIKIPTMQYVQKLNELSLLLGIIVPAVIHDPSNKQSIVKRLMVGAEILMQDEGLWQKSNVHKQNIELFKKYAISLMEQQNRALVDKFGLIIINQTMVLTCSIMQQFMLKTIYVISLKKPEILIEISNKKEIGIADIIKIGKSEEIISQIRESTINSLNYLGVEKLFKQFERIGIDVESVFLFNGFTDESCAKYKNAGFEMLQKTIGNRDDIVHRDALPYTKYEEVVDVSDYFQKIILSLSKEILAKYGINIDIIADYLLQNAK